MWTWHHPIHVALCLVLCNQEKQSIPLPNTLNLLPDFQCK